MALCSKIKRYNAETYGFMNKCQSFSLFPLRYRPIFLDVLWVKTVYKQYYFGS